jgi:hypothetical protein
MASRASGTGEADLSQDVLGISVCAPARRGGSCAPARRGGPCAPARRRTVRIVLALLALAWAIVPAALSASAAAQVTRASPSSAAAAPPAAGPVLWTAPVSIADHPLDGVSCPTSSLCAAVDHDGQVFTSSDPAAGAGSWRGATVDGSAVITAISCPSSGLCVATDGVGDVITSTDPTGGAAAWTVSRVDTSTLPPNADGAGPALLRGISCPSDGLCVAVDGAGNAVVSSDPAAGPSAWSMVPADPNSSPGCAQAHTSCPAALTGVACPVSSLCEAVDFSANVLQSTTPTASVPWSSRSLSGGAMRSLWGISCPTQTLCLTVDGYGGHVISWNPSAPGATRFQNLPYGLFGVWCPSGSLCLLSASTDGGASVLLGSSDPTALRPSWTQSPLGAVRGVACPAPSLCVAVDGAGDVIEGAPASYLGPALVSQLLSPARPPRAGALLRSGRYVQRFTSPIAGRLTILWTLPPASRGEAPIVIASGERFFSGAQSEPVYLRLTQAGRGILRSATRRLTVRATAAFQTPTGSLSRRRALTLAPLPRRHRHRRKHR